MTPCLQNAVEASFEIVGNAIGLSALAVAVILAAPFMVLAWALYRMGVWQ